MERAPSQSEKPWHGVNSPSHLRPVSPSRCGPQVRDAEQCGERDGLLAARRRGEQHAAELRLKGQFREGKAHVAGQPEGRAGLRKTGMDQGCRADATGGGASEDASPVCHLAQQICPA